MGYRSTFTTDDWYFNIPDWFVEKYPGLNYGEVDDLPALPISSKWESKFYEGAKDERWLDLAKVLRESTADVVPAGITVALLHEDALIDRVIIEPYKVTIQRSLGRDFGEDEIYDIPLKENS